MPRFRRSAKRRQFCAVARSDANARLAVHSRSPVLRCLMKKNLSQGSKRSRITVEPVDVCDFYEVGNWTDHYPSIRLGYKADGYVGKISDLAYCLKDNGAILGYFLAYNVINVDREDRIPLYSKKLVLYDFAVSARAYAKYGVHLIGFLIRYAENNGYHAIEIPKNENFPFFFAFLTRHFRTTEFDDASCLFIDAPKCKASEKHLLLYDTDKIGVDDIYFLYDLHFSVGKTVIRRKWQDTDTISVDRASGRLRFSRNVELLRDEVLLNAQTRSILHLLCNRLPADRAKGLRIDYSAAAPESFAIYSGDTVYVNKPISALVGDAAYVRAMMNRGIRCIASCIVLYDRNDRSFSDRYAEMLCENLLKMHARGRHGKRN